MTTFACTLYHALPGPECALYWLQPPKPVILTGHPLQPLLPRGAPQMCLSVTVRGRLLARWQLLHGSAAKLCLTPAGLVVQELDFHFSGKLLQLRQVPGAHVGHDLWGASCPLPCTRVQAHRLRHRWWASQGVWLWGPFVLRGRCQVRGRGPASFLSGHLLVLSALVKIWAQQWCHACPGVEVQCMSTLCATWTAAVCSLWLTCRNT